MWNRLRGRLRPAAPAEPVDLDLVQQVVLLTLRRFGPQPYSRLAAEVGASRPATPAEITSGILKLESAGMIARTSEPDLRQADRRYRLTKRGRRISRFIPPEPRSVLSFRI